MKIEQTAPGTLTFAAESRKDVNDLFKQFRLDKETQEYIDALTSGHYVHFSQSDTRPWFAVETTCDIEWLAPYFDHLERITGWRGDLGEIDPAPWNNYDFTICATHISTHARIVDGRYISKGFIQSQDWDGKTAAQRADINYAEYVRDFLGETYSEPEFIKAGNGLLMGNPNYMKRHRPRPNLSSRAIWSCIFTAWRERHATPGQREIIDNAESSYVRGVSKAPYAFFEALMREHASYSINGFKDHISFEQFKNA